MTPQGIFQATRPTLRKRLLGLCILSTATLTSL